MRALYVSPMLYGANAAVDAIGHGLQSRLASRDIELRVTYADFASENWQSAADEAVRAGADGGYDAIIIWVIDPAVPADAVGYARSRGIPVVSLERPRFSVDGSVVYPNFNHGVYMAQYLATLVGPGARVAVVGGPDVVDDVELMIGLLHGIEIAGLTRVNDPEDPRYKNTTDVASGGREKTANLLADFDELDALIPFNDETMLGAVEALRERRPAWRSEDGVSQWHSGRGRPGPGWGASRHVGHRPSRHRSDGGRPRGSPGRRAREPGRPVRGQPDRPDDHA